MKVEIQFLTKLVDGRETGEFSDLRANGFEHKYFSEGTQQVLKFIEEYEGTYGVVPDKASLLEGLPSRNPGSIFQDESPAAPLAAIYDAVISFSLQNALHNQLTEVAKKYNDSPQNAHGVLEELRDRVNTLTLEYSRSSISKSTFSEGVSEVLDFLENGETRPLGIASSFLFLEQMNRGFQPGGLSVIAAPPGLGKTWKVVMNAVTATTGDFSYFYADEDLPISMPRDTVEAQEKRRAKVLLVSMEMPKRAVYHRLAALYSRVSYARYMDGKLHPDERDRLKDTMAYMTDDPVGRSIADNLLIIGPGEANTPQAIHQHAEEFGANMVMIDGFYLMPGPGDERWQRVQSNMQLLRMYSLQSNMHYMLTTQLRRDTKSIQHADLDSLAFSVSIGQDATNVFALLQNKQLAEQAQVNVSIMKMRDGVAGQAYTYDWDFIEGRYVSQGLYDEQKSSFLTD